MLVAGKHTSDTVPMLLGNTHPLPHLSYKSLPCLVHSDKTDDARLTHCCFLVAEHSVYFCQTRRHLRARLAQWNMTASSCMHCCCLDTAQPLQVCRKHVSAHRPRSRQLVDQGFASLQCSASLQKNHTVMKGSGHHVPASDLSCVAGDAAIA